MVFFFSDHLNENIYVTIENLPNTDFNEYANFCFENKTDITYYQSVTVILWCKKVYNGRYLLYQQKSTPNKGNVIYLRNIYIYGKLIEKNYEKNGKISIE